MKTRKGGKKKTPTTGDWDFDDVFVRNFDTNRGKNKLTIYLGKCNYRGLRSIINLSINQSFNFIRGNLRRQKRQQFLLPGLANDRVV